MRETRLPPPAPDGTALVTGASSGIGVELANSLAQRGHSLTLVARRRDRLESEAEMLRGRYDVRVDVIAADVADSDGRAHLAAELGKRGLKVDILVNNAGFGTGGPFVSLDLERELAMIRVNSEAVVAMCGTFVPGMVDRGSGAVLNVASTIGFQPLLDVATYCATKAFTLAFTEALHGELKGTGVAVTALCPGPVKTEFMDEPGIADSASDLPAVMWLETSAVAEQAIRGLEHGRRVVVPGTLNRLSTWAGRHTNRSVIFAVQRALSR